MCYIDSGINHSKFIYTLDILCFQERKSIRPTFSAEAIYGGTLLAVRTNEFICFYDWVECRVVRRIDVVVKVTTVLCYSCFYLNLPSFAGLRRCDFTRMTNLFGFLVTTVLCYSFLVAECLLVR